MKKLFTILSLLTLFTPAFAENFFTPEWSEFAPSSFKNVNVDGFHWSESGKYWADRKARFDKRIEKCNSLSGNSQAACYKELRELEVNANKMRREALSSGPATAIIYSSSF